MRSWSNVRYGIKGIARVAIRIAVELIHRAIIKLFDTLFGFLSWPEKKLRLKIFILMDSEGNRTPASIDTDKSIDFVSRTFKKKFNVKLMPHYTEEPFAELL